MPTFEIEGPDGAAYELEANDEASAVAAFKKFSAGSAAPPAATTGDEAAAVGRGMLNGVPVIGPALLGGVNRAAAGIRSLQNGTPYADEMKNVEAFGTRTAEANPKSTLGGEIAGGIVGTAPLVAAAPAFFGAGAGGLGARIGASTLTNGALGGADAAVRSDGDLDAIERGMKFGAIGGAAAPVLGAAVGKVAETVASKIKPAEAVPAVAELKAGARAAYQRADDAGVQISQPSFGGAIQDIALAAREAGIDRTIHPKASAALARLEEAAGEAPTLRNVDLLRRIVKGAAGSIEPDEKRIASLMVDKLDDFVGGLKPADLVRGDAEAATKALGEARDLWGRSRRAERFETALTKAHDQVGTGVNKDRAIRQNVRAILDSPKQRAGYNADEIAAMRKIVRGGPVQNAFRLVGKVSPSESGLMAVIGLAATAANPMLAAAPAAGYTAKRLAEHLTTRGVDNLGSMIRNGGKAPISGLALPARRAVEPLAITGFGSAPRVANQQR